MSYQIYYQRAFIKIPAGTEEIAEDLFIPIVSNGSNNCWEVSYKNREIPEKNWTSLNYPYAGKFLFTAEELKEWAEKYDACSKDHHKTRYTCFKPGEMARWLINGMKSAQTLEYYLENGNSFHVCDWTNWKDQKCYYPKTSAELLQLVDRLKGIKHLNFTFPARELHLPRKTRNKKPQKTKKVAKYFVLYNESTGTLCRLTRNGYKYSYHCENGKKFECQEQALKYLEKYKNRLKGFEVEEIQKEAYL